jgi:o-succinylbenzoate synthase
VRLDIRRQTFRLHTPFETSAGTLRERETLLVALTDDDGASGHGEAAPLEGYDGVSLEQAERALERCRGAIEASASPLNGRPDDDSPAAELLRRCRRACELPQALAALDTALWDLAARRRDLPLYSLLVDDAQITPRVPVNATIAALDSARAAEQVAEAARRGYTCAKLKVGVGDDAGRVAAARAAAGPGMALRLDANGAWRVEEAVAAIAALEPAGIELVEEPVHGVAALREVRERVHVPVAVDESASQPGALDGAADAVCLKLSLAGGVTGLPACATRARAAGCEVYVASTLEGPLGVAAALHAAVALASRGPLRPCGLATLGMFEGLEKAIPVRDGAIAVAPGAGLGFGGLGAPDAAASGR